MNAQRKSEKTGVPPDWALLRRKIDHAEMTFVESEIATGLTFANLALNSTDGDKISRYVRHARTAYETAMLHAKKVLGNRPGLEQLRKKIAHLEQQLKKLGEQR